MPDNRQVLNNLEAYVQDRLNITKSLNNRLGLTESSLPGAQSVTVALVQSGQLTTNIPNNSPNSTEIGQQDDYDYQDNREGYLYQVDGTMDTHTPTDHSADDEDTELDNNVCKRQRKIYAPADTIRKDMTKQRQAQLLKNQQEKERTKAQALENRDKTDKNNKTRTHKSTAQPEDNRCNIDDTNNPRTQKSKGKASHSDQVKRYKQGKRTPRASNDPPLDPDTQDEGILIADEYIIQDDGKYAVGPDEIGFYIFFLEGQGNPPDLMGIEDDQLLAIQNDLCARFKARDEARERAVSNKLHKLEQKHEFANAQFLKHFAQVSELLEPTAKDAQAKVKPTYKMLMLPALFDSEKPEKAKTNYERFNQYIKFQTKEGNIKDTTKEAIELFENTLDKKALIWFQQHKAEFKDLTTLKNMFLARYNSWGKTMPTIIQTHLIIEPNWAEVTKKVKNLEHIIRRCDPLAIAPPIVQGTGAVPSLYSHIAQSQDQDLANIPKPFKRT